MKQTLTNRQLISLSFVSMLSPFLRLIPGSITDLAGSAAWVSAALSIVPISLLCLCITAFLGHFSSETGLAEGFLQSLGPVFGRILLGLWGLWLLFHSGFLLCSGADRFIATIYPGIKPTIFILVTAAICLVAALGKLKAIARASEIFQPLLLFVIAPVLLFSVTEVELTFLLPVTKTQIKPILKGIPLAAEAVSVVLINIAFLSKCTSTHRKAHKLLPWLLGVTIFSTIFCGICIGNLGKTYISALAYPFFILARDLSILSGVERIEALVVGLWLLPDFVLIVVEWMIAADLFLLITNRESNRPAHSICILLGTAFALSVAFRIAPDSQQLAKWSDQWIPAIHLSWAYLVLPCVFLVSTLRKKF